MTRPIRIVRARRTDCYCGGFEDPLPDGEGCERCDGTRHIINRLGIPDHCPCFIYSGEEALP